MLRRRCIHALTLAVVCALFLPGSIQAGILFPASINASFTFSDAITSMTPMGMAFDGTHYWEANGGTSSGQREAQYTASGNLVSTFAPGLDFRSVFTDAAGNVYASTFSSPQVYKQTAPGVFTPFVVLTGGSLDPQSDVVLNGAGTEYIAQSGGTVQRWDLAGNFIAAVPLAGFGSVTGENVYPASRNLAAFGAYWLTYSSGTLSAWNASGVRVDQTALNGAGTSFDANFSLSYANGMAFIVDQVGGTWRGYSLGGGAPVVPEPQSLILLASGLSALLALGRRRKQRLQ